MESLFQYVAPPSQCGYLHDRHWSLEYDYVGELTAAEYLQKMLDGWRRFGHMLFRPVCASCRACKPLRVRVDAFRPDRSQRRCRKRNEGEILLQIREPSVDREKLALYDRYHAFQADWKNWPEHAPKDADSYFESFVHQPFPVEEWGYFLGDRLVGIGYVDACEKALPSARGQEGLSAIYFFHDPELRERGLGTWNILCLLDEARRRGLPYLYLGYYVEGCASMAYKPRFVPNEVRHDDNSWQTFVP